MGSSYSVHNDTGDDLWVWDGVNVDAIVWPSVGIFAIVTAGATAAAIGVASAGAAAGTAVAAKVAAAGAGATSFGQLTAGLYGLAGTVAGGIVKAASTVVATQLSVVAILSGASAASIAAALKIPEAQAEKLKEQTIYFKENCNRKLRSGDTHSSGKLSLSLTRTVWFMNDRTSEVVSRNCWTGATANSTMR